AIPRSIGRDWACACTILSQHAQASLGRTVRITLKRTGSSSSVSQTSSPNALSSLPQSGQASSRGAIVQVSRGRCSGKTRGAFGAAAELFEFFAATHESCASVASSSSTHNSSCSICRARFSLFWPNCIRRNFKISSFSDAISVLFESSSAFCDNSSSSLDNNAACCSSSNAFNSATSNRSRSGSTTLADFIRPSYERNDACQLRSAFVLALLPTTLSRKHRRSGTHRAPPIDSLQQHRELRRR